MTQAQLFSQMRTLRDKASVTQQDPVGPSWDRPLPHMLCFSSSLKYQDNSI